MYSFLNTPFPAQGTEHQGVRYLFHVPFFHVPYFATETSTFEVICIHEYTVLPENVYITIQTHAIP